MKIRVEDSFKKDIDKILDKGVLSKLKEKIIDMSNAASLKEISNLKKLKGHNYYYRIRLGNFRIGISFVNDEVALIRFLNRKDIYRFFP